MFRTMSIGVASFMSVVATVDGKLRENATETKIQMKTRRATTILAVKMGDLPLDTDLDIETFFRSAWKVRCLVQVLVEIPFKPSDWAVWALNSVFSKRYQGMSRFPPLS